jgi:DNA-binding CsgD family transcriptional regulator
MREAIEVMAKVRETPFLDDRIKLFSKFLEAEFKYDGFVYGIGLDTSSMESLMQTFQVKMDGMNEEWLNQYVAEGLAVKDISVLHVAFREGILHQSKIFEAADRGDIPDFFAEVPNRVRDYSRSGFFISLRSRGLMGGVGIHSSIMTPDQHDAQFVNNGHIIVELCRQFHDMACWKHDIVATTGLSEMNLKVLELRSQGLLAKQIIEITGHEHENSVAQHMQQVRQKLGTKNEKQTMVRAASLGLTGQMGFSEASLKQLEENAKNIAEREKWLGEIV